MSETPDLVDEILAGENRGLQLLAAQGILPLAQEEIIRVQVALAAGGDPEIVSAAQESLSSTDPSVLLPYLRRDAGPEALEYFVRTSTNAAVLETVVQRRDLPLELAMLLAPRADATIQEILLLRQDMIVDHPELLEAIETNESLSKYSRRRIREYRAHLLAPDKEEEPEPEPAFEEFEEDEELVAAVQEVLEEVEPEGEVDEKTGLSEGQIRALASPLRVKLARGAGRSLRAILIKDKNPQVATAVLTGSAVSESEIEQISANRSVVEEVLTMIANRREWANKYGIVHNLIKNPRTPAGISIRFLPRLSVRDLGRLRFDRGVSDAVRRQAVRLFQIKTK